MAESEKEPQYGIATEEGAVLDLEPSPNRRPQFEDLGYADEAIELAREHSSAEVIALDVATDRTLLRKIDWNILPIMCVVYGLNYLDKTTLSYASIIGLQEELNLTKSNYQWLGSIFYFGYLAFEYPTSRLLQRLPLAKWTGANVIFWGMVLALTAVCADFGGIAAVRFILGMLEGSVTPGFVLLTSQWYTKKEQGIKTSIWFSFNGFANVLGGLVAYGVAKGSLAKHEAVASWKILFLLWGSVTVAVGAVFVILMPDSPLKARFLNSTERRLAVERTRSNQQGRIPLT